MSSQSGALERAYGACEQLARSHYENFPVASRLLPAAIRRHVAALYAFARVADDIADEGAASPAERHARLRAWQEQLHRAAGECVGDSRAERDDLLLTAMGNTIRAFNLPLKLFDDLVSAFSQDITTVRYDSWNDVLDYCRRSANPVGRLVLRIAGYSDGSLDEASDALCTALQLTNFWQDFGRDWRAGRLYVPREVHLAQGASEESLTDERMSPAWASAIDVCAAFTRRRFAEGVRVCDGVRGRLGFELKLTWLGGARILERTVAGRFDLFANRPVLGTADAPLLLWRALRWPPQERP